MYAIVIFAIVMAMFGVCAICDLIFCALLNIKPFARLIERFFKNLPMNW